ncbi:uncharacterized protein STEHIDRAFT_153110 [Stereum hirsutum FP-91666 SS1]|uniref:uncharacterized protein n=1 Tax=Stereum hirsutum (strain FP-91666) TaxID=721885 RepID=UPI000440EFE7|nr:uncharacterized protein STEHIDRAFT_153110 [Stereum hirsutum FP-91666 SS1]EIM91470.1 hypothetical protein STEHIDRAFT_153110 [Stereum hirsutum FP-91666 SS1]
MEHHDGRQDRYVLAQALWKFVLLSALIFTFFEPSRKMDDSRRTEEPRNDLYPTFERSDHNLESVLGGMYHFRSLVCSQQNTETRISANRLPTVPAIPRYYNARAVGVDYMHPSSASALTWSPPAGQPMSDVYSDELLVQERPQAVADPLILPAPLVGDVRQYRHKIACRLTATGRGLGGRSTIDLAGMSHMQSNANHTYGLVSVKFGRTMGPVSIVPQSEYRHSSKAGQTRYGRPLDLTSIAFVSVDGNGAREDGVIVEDALKGFKGCPVELEGADDIVLEGSVVNITVHIMWFGREPWKNLISTRCLQEKRIIPMTRGILAQRLAKALVKFMQHVRWLDTKSEMSATPNASGLLSIPAAGQMVIRSLNPVTHGGWQVDLAVAGVRPII